MGTFSPALVVIRTMFPNTCFMEKRIEILISILTGFGLHTTIYHSLFFSHRNVKVANQAKSPQTDFVKKKTCLYKGCSFKRLLCLEATAATCILELQDNVFSFFKIFFSWFFL